MPHAKNDSTPAIRETHSGMVILAGDRAYKIKKPVDLHFLDFSSVSSRTLACRREIELNRRLAPDVYLGLGSFSGPEAPQESEPVIVMRRMPDARRLSTLVSRGCDVDDELRSLGRLLAAFHSGARRGPQISREGTQSALRSRWVANLAESVEYCGSVLDQNLWDHIQTLALRYVDGRGPLFADRAADGCVVDGHGDLIAEDVFCLPDGPRVLDCLEFDDRLRWVDVLDDVAFLAMDLEHLGAPAAAERFLGWYCEFSAMPVVQSLQHHFIAYRAFVRAKVASIRAAQESGSDGGVANAFAGQALRHLHAGEVRMVLVGGAPGTGKSTLAAALADRLGAVLLSSDHLRQELSLAADARYTSAGKAATYTALLARAHASLSHGESVVLDATWGELAGRTAAEEVAETTASTLTAFECRAPAELAARRAEHRLAAGHDASEAGADVALRLAADRALWPEAVGVDTSRSPQEALGNALMAFDVLAAQ